MLKVPKATYSTKTSWKVRVPPSLCPLEGLKRKFFDKEAIAKTYKERLARLAMTHQLQAATLNDSQRLEAYECFVKLEPLGATLRAAVDHYAEYLATARKSMPVRA